MAPPEDFPKTPLHQIARHSGADPSRNGESKAGGESLVCSWCGGEYKKTAGAPASAVKYPLKVCTAGESHPAREAFAPRREVHPLTVRRCRPFARRREMILRPAFVLMRARNPCLLTRRRLLGW